MTFHDSALAFDRDNDGRTEQAGRTRLTSALWAIVSAVDAKDPQARGHSLRVARIAVQLARAMGLSADDVAEVELAGLLHDIGKIAVPESILTKPAQLDPNERIVMMAHASIGADILASIDAPELVRIANFVRHHHEWHLGGGYPAGIAGDDIPLGAAIVAVADAFDTMTTPRAYRATLSLDATIQELRRSAGLQFHPRVVEAAVSIFGVDTGASIESQPARAGSANAVSDDSALISPIDARRVSVLHRVAAAIAGMRDLPAFLRDVSGIVAEELGYQNLSILLLDNPPDNLVIAAGIWPNGTSYTGTRVAIEGSLAGRVFQTGQPANVADFNGTTDDQLTQWTAARSELVVPLTTDERTIGVVSVQSSATDSFSSHDLRLLTAIASQIAPALALAQAHDEYRRAAQRDGLTGIYNHAAFYERLHQFVADGRQFALFIFDVEGLKRVNDTAGHLAGDSLLRRVAAALDLATRPEDVVARYGGDEFAVLADGIGADTAVDMALRLQSTVNQLTWGPHGEHVSISVGVAVSGVDGTDATELVARADRRMYDTRTESRAGRGITTELRERRTRRHGH
jgi:diguanylate cyclase (GGDEF)-like protein/putative nucleotidyltransferase with HDIG domain